MHQFFRDAARLFILALPAILILALLDAGFMAAWVHSAWLDALEVLPLFSRDLLWSAATLVSLLAASTCATVVFRRVIAPWQVFDDRRLALTLSTGLAAVLGAVAFHHSLEALQARSALRLIVLLGYCVWVGAVTATAWVWASERRFLGISLASLLLIALLPLASGIRVDIAEATEAPPDRAARSSEAEPLVDSIVLITLDTTRLDAVGYSGSERTHTPVLDRLAAEGAAFLNATTPVPLTLPSHTSMMTGLLPWQHGVVINGARIPADVHTLAEVLIDAGWRTGGFVSAPVVEAETGIARGFERFDDGFSSGRLPSKGMATARLIRRVGLVEYPSVRRGDDVAKAAVEWIDARRRDERAFLWLHLFDSHAPYEATLPIECEHSTRLEALDRDESARFASGHDTPDWFADHLHEIYDREVEGMDRQVGEVVEALERSGRLGSSLIIVLADHGESFDEPERFDHAGTLTEDTLRIPLIVRLEGVVEPGARPTTLASVQDVHSTVLEAASIASPLPADSHSLIAPYRDPVLARLRRHTRHETYPHPMASSRERLVAVRNGRSKLVVVPERNEREFIHVDEDDERDRMLDTDRREELEQLSSWLTVDESSAARVIAKVDLMEDDETIEMLRSLGYVD
jgi:arylsulfatase A-like enzyme